jgi:hypothetical protein
MFNGGRDGFYHIKLVLHLPMQSMPLVNKIASSISSRGRMNWTKFYVVNKH